MKTKQEKIKPEEVQEKKEKKAPKGEVKQHVYGKKYQEVKIKVDKTRNYSISEAVKLLKEISFTKFDSTIEIHAVVKKEGTSVNVKLPHSTGKTKKIEIADEKTLEKLKSGKIDFDILLATADMMPKLVPFAKLLGPKGMMPNPKAGTLIKSAKEADKFKGNTLTIKAEKKDPLVHTIAGKVSQPEKELEENIEAILTALGKTQIIKAYLKSTMSPSVKLSI